MPPLTGLNGQIGSEFANCVVRPRSAGVVFADSLNGWTGRFACQTQVGLVILGHAQQRQDRVEQKSTKVTKKKASRWLILTPCGRLIPLALNQTTPLGLSQGFNGFCTTSLNILGACGVVQKPLNHRGKPGGGTL
jgi:hypothetical protein